MAVNLGDKPLAGFGEPIEMMKDCHRRIEHFLNVLRKVEGRFGEGVLDDEGRRPPPTNAAYPASGFAKLPLLVRYTQRRTPSVYRYECQTRTAKHGCQSRPIAHALVLLAACSVRGPRLPGRVVPRSRVFFRRRIELWKTTLSQRQTSSMPSLFWADQ